MSKKFLEDSLMTVYLNIKGVLQREQEIVPYHASENLVVWVVDLYWCFEERQYTNSGQYRRCCYSYVEKTEIL